MREITVFLLLFFLAYGPNSAVGQEYDFWLSEWAMAENVMDREYKIANSQFDDLLKREKKISRKIFIFGLIAKFELNRLDQVERLLAEKPYYYTKLFCGKANHEGIDICISLPLKKVRNNELRYMIIMMYVVDQYVRSNVMTPIIEKYDLDSSQINQALYGDTDIVNTEKLKKIIHDYGFPTLEMVGHDAMNGVFYIIQHSPDIAFQEEMLPNIKKAVENGELDADTYAYLYDRINVRKGKKQRFGTQIESIKFEGKALTFYPIEDSLNIDQRRMKYEMEPFRLYKKRILNAL